MPFKATRPVFAQDIETIQRSNFDYQLNLANREKGRYSGPFSCELKLPQKFDTNGNFSSSQMLTLASGSHRGDFSLEMSLSVGAAETFDLAGGEQRESEFVREAGLKLAYLLDNDLEVFTKLSTGKDHYLALEDTTGATIFDAGIRYSKDARLSERNILVAEAGLDYKLFKLNRYDETYPLNGEAFVRLVDGIRLDDFPVALEVGAETALSYHDKTPYDKWFLSTTIFAAITSL